jgi:RND family efflux transporter MFP subunit
MLPVAPRNSARLLELLVDEGSEVKKDQLLAQLEDSDLLSTVTELQARAEFAERDFRRLKPLAARGVISKQERDRAEAEMQAAEAAVARAQSQADYMRLTAPADGRVIRRDGEIGELISANQALFWISCCAPLRISAEVDEEDISLVQAGQRTVIRADAFPGQTFNGVVQSITPKGDAIARSFRVRIGFDEGAPLMIGMTTEVNVVVRDTAQALLIPTEAVVGDTVSIVEGDRVLLKQVTIGARGREATEILTGIAEDALVVHHPDQAPKGGEPVRWRLQEFVP